MKRAALKAVAVLSSFAIAAGILYGYAAFVGGEADLSKWNWMQKDWLVTGSLMLGAILSAPALWWINLRRHQLR